MTITSPSDRPTPTLTGRCVRKGSYTGGSTPRFPRDLVTVSLPSGPPEPFDTPPRVPSRYVRTGVGTSSSLRCRRETRRLRGRSAVYGGPWSPTLLPAPAREYPHPEVFTDKRLCPRRTRRAEVGSPTDDHRCGRSVPESTPTTAVPGRLLREGPLTPSAPLSLRVCRGTRTLAGGSGIGPSPYGL